MTFQFREEVMASFSNRKTVQHILVSPRRGEEETKIRPLK